MKKVITVCPYCASGCKINLLVENNKIVGTEAAMGLTNQGELCLKGYYGWDFVSDTKILTPRLTQPMIRYKRGEAFTPVSWDEAISYTASRLQEIKQKYGKDSIMVTGSSRGSGNEANYVMQKFARAVLGNNNVDCCARVCHGPSVAGLLKSIGNGAMSNSIVEIEETKCILIIGYNPSASHPIVARRINRAKQKGAKVIVCDPRKIETARIADIYAPIENGCNVAFVNTLMNIVLEEKLQDQRFIDSYTENFDAFYEVVKKYTPEATQDITGIKPEMMREIARTYANAETATILWGMGVCQFRQGVETVQALASLAMLTGNLCKPNVGVGPVRGQNNVQGACDMGALYNILPGYQSFKDPEIRAKFAKAWGVPEISAEPGVPLTEVPNAVKEGKIKAFYIMGEDTLQTEPDLHAVREAFKQLEFVIVQDIFMTQTAAEADVILPATSCAEHEGVYTSADRGFQRFYKAVDAVGNVKDDWVIISEIATAMGYPMHYNNTKEIWDELRELCPIYKGVTYEKMEGLGYVQWPCYDESAQDTGTQYLYKDHVFDRPGGKGELFACDWLPPVESVSEQFPLILSTVREVGHYSCRSMTGNCRALANLAEEPGFVQMNDQDAKGLGIKHNELVWVISERGKVISRADVSSRTNRGACYMTYQWWIGKCNELTGENLENLAKTPEYKYSAVRIEKINDQVWAERYLNTEYGRLKNRLKETALVA
ncbi:formate dehydrogenase alpha subunit [Mesocricetibacter intestinalis]|uniref:Formate dehydrogenase alpha subunit n=1 Tax=Mesocricetibacter intestinalis TaxID=1521930 RepID=A0A4R6VAR6_9PAST|nr:formate dehydrogenase subunit alpha [Mesocricetibacter intestinalis]TDQ57007.1 formate dehydrogenase alpha subunit [Mesocricetibacter intestinalis]